jgi:hypothetical protein
VKNLGELFLPILQWCTFQRKPYTSLFEMTSLVKLSPLRHDVTVKWR